MPTVGFTTTDEPAAMPGSTSAKAFADLEASYPIYCRALRLLVREGLSLKQVQRTVCWAKLQSLHEHRPRQYRDPALLYLLLQRQLERGSDGPPSPGGPRWSRLDCPQMGTSWS